MSPRYEYWYINGGGDPLDTYSPPTITEPADYKISSISISYNSAGTSATITVTPPTTTPGSYGGSVAGTGTFNDPDFVINDNDGTFTISPLTPGSLYSVRIRAYSGVNQTGTYGDYYYDKISPPKPASVSSTTATTSQTQIPISSAYDRWWQIEKAYTPILYSPSDNESGFNLQNQTIDTGTSVAYSGNREVQTSLFKITNNNIDKNKYSLATKNTGIGTGYSHYAFGTSMFFQSNINDVQGSGGIGFFTSGGGMNGYYVLIQTTANLADTADKEVKILKVVNGKKIVLNDSQKGSATKTLTGILGGISYKVDINVIVQNSVRVIEVYINNFKITATDTNVSGSTNPIENVLPVTSNVAMVASTGKANFDYFYATPLTEDQYKNGIIQNVYEGKYGIKTLSFLYGDKIISDKALSPSQLPFLEEFGTVARELRRVKIKYESRPGNPLYTSTGINKYVTVLGQRLTSFGAEVYVINNAGTFVPLDDSNLYSFSIVGNYIVTTGQHEYVSNTLSETTIPEPVIFESAWIQSEPDAKNLTTWIQNQWSNKQQIVELQTFGNPLISIGDVVAINYPKNGLDGTEKFVVTRVDNSFGEGLETSITARSIFS